MAVTLRKYLNSKLKAKGLTLTQAKKNAGKYKSISAAKKAGSLYYTDKNGNVMAAVYAEDLKKPLKPIKPKPDTKNVSPKVGLASLMPCRPIELKTVKTASSSITLSGIKAHKF